MKRPSPKPYPFAYHHLLALLLVCFAFAASALVSRQVFERLPHLEDEVAYLWQAKLLARGEVVIDAPTPRRAFWQPFVVDYQQRRFGKYTLGWPLLLAPGVALGQPWVVNAFLSALAVVLVYRLAREIFNPDAGVLAAALTAFSPMALLLNGTLMGHTAALFTTTLFMYACWRMSQSGHALVQIGMATFRRARPRLKWGALAGLALGLTIINRPLAGLALAGPFAAWSAVRLLQAASSATLPVGTRHVVFEGLAVRIKHVLAPLLALAGGTLLVSAVIPAYNLAATGDASKNLYTLVWSYDQVGFGEGYGRSGHTLEKGLRQTRWDLSLTAADLFGWQAASLFRPDGAMRPELTQHLLYDGDYWEPLGLSWILLPFGLLIGLRRRSLLLALWLALGALILMQTTNLPIDQLRNREFAYLWMAGAALWVCLPFALFLVGQRHPQAEWTWLLLAFALALIGLHFAYWIGSQRYSTRYYYEMLAALAIISALPLAWLARRLGRWPVYLGVAAILLYSLYAYSLPRISVLYRFNWVSPELIQAVEARRDGERPVLVLLEGADVKWRALGPLMVVTSPRLDSAIVAAIDNTQPGVRAQILAAFPNRQVIEMTAAGNRSCFIDPPETCFGDLSPAG